MIRILHICHNHRKRWLCKNFESSVKNFHMIHERNRFEEINRQYLFYTRCNLTQCAILHSVLFFLKRILHLKQTEQFHFLDFGFQTTETQSFCENSFFLLKILMIFFITMYTPLSRSVPNP